MPTLILIFRNRLIQMGTEGSWQEQNLSPTDVAVSSTSKQTRISKFEEPNQNLFPLFLNRCAEAEIWIPIILMLHRIRQTMDGWVLVKQRLDEIPPRLFRHQGPCNKSLHLYQLVQYVCFELLTKAAVEIKLIAIQGQTKVAAYRMMNEIASTKKPHYDMFSPDIKVFVWHVNHHSFARGSLLDSSG